MISNKELIKVTNRDNGHIGYSIPDLNNLVRNYTPGETKEIPMEELRKLSFLDGGMVILREYLVIQNEEAIKELLNSVEPEYYYTEKEIKDLLLNGSLDALKDCLDYAPTGTIDLLKKIAVEMPLNDVEKRKAILNMTGFNVTSAVEINEETKEESQENNKVRRLNEPKNDTVEQEKTTGRRVAVGNYSSVHYLNK